MLFANAHHQNYLVPNSSFTAKRDVTKQDDMTGFYRYILNETTKDPKKEEDQVRYANFFNCIFVFNL